MITTALLEGTLQARRLDATDGALPVGFHSLSSDTRTLQSGALFVALSGPNFNANLFLNQAVSAGASGIICSQLPEHPLPIPAWEVPDTLTAMTQLAKAWRQQLNAHTVGITGSSGKTTVKEMLGLILSHRYRTGITRGNLNNHIGVPLTLLNTAQDRTHLVIEMGMSAADEITHLAQIAQPQVGIVTNIMPAHVEGFGDGTLQSALVAIAHAKGELIEALPNHGTAILPIGDEHFSTLRSKASCTILTFGIDNSGADITFTPPTLRDTGMQSLITLPNRQQFEVTLPGFGAYLWQNAVAACAAAYASGVEMADMAAGLNGFKLQSGRGNVLKGRHGCRILNDTYNANAGAVKAAIEALAQMAPKDHRLAVLGDMLELGQSTEQLHAGLAEDLVAHDVQRVFLAGPQMHALKQELEKAPGIRVFHNTDPVALADDLAQCVGEGDAVLIKGSRGMRMERVVDTLKS
ncbi:UDP-N-acetylmuramoyl-tripeptide--D-alanyl-D-alanine ligase [Magnetococcus sp. PR-3]|uniref:UDP-N-acetylmuramoyl-tripeptide--D-alanyl-D- alanine ligase n=1 Tax=Magnetococcus sp. PR-3 TaxID=3120355 RepID=UPI002FCDE222